MGNKWNRTEAGKAWRRTQERKYTLRYSYGISIDEYNAMMEAQNGRCAICGALPKDNKKRRLVVDHDHTTKKIRGLLCPPCNVALNGMERVSNWSEKAARYLTGSKEIY